MKLEKQFKVRIVYKSGYTHDFWCTQFEFNQGTYSWKAVSAANDAIIIGADDIAAVFQVGVRTRIAWGLV